MNYRLWELLDSLSDTEYRTAGDLGISLGVSEKTVRTRIKELNEYIASIGGQVESKPRYGYRLNLTLAKQWMEFVGTRDGKLENPAVPSDSKERIDYLLSAFLNRSEYLKTEELSDFLYISTKTLSNELKKVEYILQQFGIGLEKKPYYGIRAVGGEFNKRCCLLHNFYLASNPLTNMRKDQEENVRRIASALMELAKKYDITFTENAFQNTVLYVHISISRIKKEFVIQPETIPPADREKREYQTASELYQTLMVHTNQPVPESEIYYTGLYIAGKRMMGAGAETNLVISDRINGLVTRILENVNNTYQIDFRDNLNLRLMLGHHLIPMEIRIKYGIPIERIAIQEVKDQHIFSYTMAQQTVAILSEAFGKPIPEAETACLALYFALAAEEKKASSKRRMNILLVCVSGKASSQMLMHRFRREFREYIDTLQVCSMYDFEQYELSNIDYIFTTVRIYKKVPIPIMEIHDFLKSDEIMTIRHFLQMGDMQFLSSFYQERYFFTDLNGTTKEEVIHQLCARIQQHTPLPEEFEDSVLQRESFGPTDFGNLVAIPHPCKFMTKDTIVAVAVLAHEIIWTSRPVKVVILTSLSGDQMEETQKFYEVTANFLMNPSSVSALLAEPGYSNFIALLCADNAEK